jgi:hypothetical protein
LIAGLLGSDYRPGQMTYDLRRLRLAGLIRRHPHTNRYTLTADGIRIAIAYTKIYWRASHFPDCGPNKVRPGKDDWNWQRSTRISLPSFVTKQRNWSWKVSGRSRRSLANMA